MKKSYSYLSAASLLIISAAFIVSCQQPAAKPENPGISEILEKALTGVVTIKFDETELGKAAFGFANDETQKMSAADIAYAEVLQLENAKGTGSGFVILHEGKKYIITNAHVIETVKDVDKSIIAYSYERKEHSLKLVGADSYYDIAVLSFQEEPDSTIIPIVFAEENYRIGQTCYAIGNPLSYFPYTVTQGIISAKNRAGISAKSGYLQSTAMLSAGNSGGPLINEKGELLGVNTLGSTEAQQLNFSLEAGILKKIVKDIIEFGRVKRAYFGLEIYQLNRYYYDKDDNLQTELVNKKPVIYGFIPNSPASGKSDEYSGYSILQANEKSINSNEDLIEIFESLKPGDTLRLNLDNEGKTSKTEFIAGELNDARLTEIANYYFTEHYNIALEKNNSGVIIDFPQGEQSNTFQAYDPSIKKFRDYIPRGGKSYIIGCGNTSDMNSLDIWRVNEFKDLGNALKLSTINGQISFLEYDGNTSWINRVLISDRKDIISKTILY